MRHCVTLGRSTSGLPVLEMTLLKVLVTHNQGSNNGDI